MILSALIMLLAACSGMTNKGGTPTRIMPVRLGETIPVREFKAGFTKPYAHIVWGDNVPDGARCSITITNVTKVERVYERMFIHDTATERQGYSFEGGTILEMTAEWNNHIGNYLMELHVSGRRVATAQFRIVP